MFPRARLPASRLLCLFVKGIFRPCLSPTQSAFPQYEFPQAKQQYAEIADMLGLGGHTEDEKVGGSCSEGLGFRAP